MSAAYPPPGLRFVQGVGAGWSLRERMVEAAKSHWRRRDTTACRCGRGRRLPLRSGAASYSLALSAQAGSKANMIDGALRSEKHTPHPPSPNHLVRRRLLAPTDVLSPRISAP